MEFVVRLRNGSELRIEGNSVGVAPGGTRPAVVCTIGDARGKYVAVVPVDVVEAIYHAEAVKTIS